MTKNVEEVVAEVEKATDQLDIDYQRIKRKADEAEVIAEDKGIDLEQSVILPFFDMNGPIVDKQTVDYGLNEGVRKAISYLDRKSQNRLSMLSGWDIQTLDFVSTERLGVDMDHVGELGSQAVIDGEEFTTVEADYDDIIDFRREVMLEAAADELTLNEQGNVSPLTGCTYIEGHRKGMFENHPIAQNSAEKFSSQALYEEMVERGADETDIALGDQDVITGLPDRISKDSGDYLAVDLGSQDSMRALSSALTREFPLMGIKLEYVGGQEIRLTGNVDESAAMSDDNLLDYFQRFMESRAEGTSFEPDHNPDLCSDYQRTDIEVSKEYGANFRADKLLEDGEEPLILNVGDKPGDVIDVDNTVFFAQQDYPAEEYIDEQGIDAVKVENAADYALVAAELLERHSETDTVFKSVEEEKTV